MNAAVYFGIKLLTAVSVLLVDSQGLEGKLYGLERQGDVVWGPTGKDTITEAKGFAVSSQLPEKASTKNRLVHNNFEWNIGELRRRAIRQTSRISPISTSVDPNTSDDSHGPKMLDIASHLLTDYGIMGVSGDEDSAKWAAEQMQNPTKGSREVNESLFQTADEGNPLKNESVHQNQSSTLQANSSSLATHANVSETRQTPTQNGNVFQNLTLDIQRGLNESLEQQANQSLNQNHTKLVAEPKVANHSDVESSGDGSLVINFTSLRPNQSFYLTFANGTSAGGVRNTNLKFSANKEVEGMTTQGSSGLLENSESENDTNSLETNNSGVAKGNGSDSLIADLDLEHGKTGTNSVATTEEDLGSNSTPSQTSNDRDVSGVLQLQGQSRKPQNSVGVARAKLEVYDDESLAKALTDSSVSSIIFSNKNLSSDNYLLERRGQKKSTLQVKQSETRKRLKGERNAVRRYFRAKKISKNQHYKLTLQSQSHVLNKKDNMVAPVRPPAPPQMSKNGSTSDSQHTVRNGATFDSQHTVGNSSTSDSQHIVGNGATFDSQHTVGNGSTSDSQHIVGNGSTSDSQHIVGNGAAFDSQHTVGNGEPSLRVPDTVQQGKIQSQYTAQIGTSSRLNNYRDENYQRNTPKTAHRVENYQVPDTGLHSPPADLTKSESQTLPSADPSQVQSKYNCEFPNNGVFGNKHENVSTSVLIQDDSGRTVYQGAINIFKARNNGVVSTGNDEENPAWPSLALKPNEKDHSSRSTALPGARVAGQNEITTQMPTDAKFQETVSSLPSIPSDAVSYSAEKQGHDSLRNYSRSAQQHVLTRNSSLYKMQQQSVGNKSREQNKVPSAGENFDVTTFSGYQQQDKGPIEKPEIINGYDSQQQTYPQSPLQQQQPDNVPQNMEHETNYLDNEVGQVQHPGYEDDRSPFKEDVFHIVLHNDNKMITNPLEHVTLTISGPLPAGVEEPVNSNEPKYNAADVESNPNTNQQGTMQDSQRNQNAQQLDNGLPGNSGNIAQQKTSAQMNRSDGRVKSSQEKATENNQQNILNQANMTSAGIVIEGRLNEKNTNNDPDKQKVEQPMSAENIMGNSSRDLRAQTAGQLKNNTEGPGNQSSSKFMDNIFIGPENENAEHQRPETGDQSSTLLNQAGYGLNSNMLVKATDRATASLSSTAGLASNDDIAAIEGPRITEDLPTADPESHKLDCRVSPQTGKSSLTVLTCRKKKFDSNVPQASKPTFYYPRVDEGVGPSRKTQNRVPRLDEVLNVLNQDTKESLNKEMMMEGKSIGNMLEGFANPRVSVADSSDFDSVDDSPVFDWTPQSHKRTSGDGFARLPWEMNMKSRSLWDPEHQIMLPNSLLKDYWRHLRRGPHRHHRLRFPWAPDRGSERGFWGFHPDVPLGGYGYFEPSSWAPNPIWSQPGSFLHGLRHRKVKTLLHQENASKRTSLFNNILKGDRDNCRPHEGGPHRHMGEWEYLGRVLCSCPFGVGEW